MEALFGDERLQFFLRNREDIKAWAAIEADVIAATRELLARSLPLIEESLLAIDANALVSRNDGGQWERVFARHEAWPGSLGLALEWQRTVDPLGATRPKLGIFWWAGTPDLIAPRVRFIESVDRTELQRLGYKVPLEGVWPVGARLSSAPDWWKDPEGWIAGIVERLTPVWGTAAPLIDDIFAATPQVSRG